MLMSSKTDLEFERNPRRQQELRLRPFADSVYRFIFGPDIEIKRFDKEAVLDREFAIDVRVRLRTGQILLGQEKFLSAAFSRYNSLTVEHMQNPQEEGDWFKLAAQMYFTGYEAVGGFSPWILVDWTALVLATLRGEVGWHDNVNRDGRAQASFRWVDLDTLPDACIIARSS